MKIILVFLAFAMIYAPSDVSLAAGKEDRESKNKSQGSCVTNFSGRGFRMLDMKSKKASSWQTFEGISYDQAFRKVAQATAKRGWTNMDSNKELGTVTAGLPGSAISIVVEEQGSIIRVEATMDLQSSSFSEKAAKETICVSVEAPGR
ncbi:MAG: hypothetical protein IPG63_18020 [Xanthomonadales bacterium]|nr:hypothetical protein [Xanthomonadales bacterium]